MSSDNVNCILISDFTIDPLSIYLKSGAVEPLVKCIIAPIDQTRNVICDWNNECWKNEPQVAVVWTQPFKAIPSFAEYYYENKKNIELIKKEVEEYTHYIKKLASRVKTVIIPSWTLPSYFRGSGVMDYKNSCGTHNTLLRMNLQLADELEGASNVYLLPAERWLMSAEKAEDEKMWYLGKIPFTRDIFISAAKDIKALLRATSGKARKLIVLDLDNTLWGDVLGDVGIEGIILGGIDPVGEAYLDFQKHLLALKKRGIMLAIASKNTEEVALEAIDKHPEMVLRRNDFVFWRINWEDKAFNIMEIAGQMNIGLHSIVFIDDSPQERARVSEALPDVLVPEWPTEPIYYKKALLSLECFDTVTASHEDNERTQYYHAENKRQKYMEQLLSLENWLHYLNLKVSYEEISIYNITRAVQLLNKTNQFNLITRRMDKKEFTDYIADKNIKALIFRAFDKFGDYGYIGLVTFELYNHNVTINDFVLSCRAMGRGIEKAMLSVIAQCALSFSKNCLLASYLPTERNKPCANFLLDSRFVKINENYYRNEHIEKIIPPSFVNIEEDIELKGAN